MKLTLTALCAGLLATTLLSVEVKASEQPDDRAMQKIVEFASRNIGKKIDRGQGGQCTELVQAALHYAYAMPMKPTAMNVMRNKQMTKVATYDWGVSFKTFGRGKKPTIPRAGAIVQFEECVFSKNGSTHNMPHHTAIVESVDGSMVTLLHQNVDGSLDKSQVRRQTVDFSGKTQGWYFVWYPVRQIYPTGG